MQVHYQDRDKARVQKRIFVTCIFFLYNGLNVVKVWKN